MTRNHGTASMYKAGCRCENCRTAHRIDARRQSNRRRHPEIYGEAFVDVTSVREMLEVLTIPQTTLRSIANRSGVAPSVLTMVMNGTQKTVRRSTYDKLRPVLLSYFRQKNSA